MNQKSNHLVLSPSYELNKDKTLLYLIFKRRRGTEQTRHKKKQSEFKLYAFEIQRKTSFANRNRRCKYTRTGKPLRLPGILKRTPAPRARPGHWLALDLWYIATNNTYQYRPIQTTFKCTEKCIRSMPEKQDNENRANCRNRKHWHTVVHLRLHKLQPCVRRGEPQSKKCKPKPRRTVHRTPDSPQANKQITAWEHATKHTYPKLWPLTKLRWCSRDLHL